LVELLGALKALSDENRLNIVKLLLKHDFCVGALARNLKVSKAAVSQHLQILRKADLVKGEKRGYFTHYRVNRALLKETADELVKLAEQIKQPVDSCKQSGTHPCCGKEGHDNGKV